MDISLIRDFPVFLLIIVYNHIAVDTIYVNISHIGRYEAVLQVYIYMMDLHTSDKRASNKR
jgi:hypothetical protein